MVIVRRVRIYSHLSRSFALEGQSCGTVWTSAVLSMWLKRQIIRFSHCVTMSQGKLGKMYPEVSNSTKRYYGKIRACTQHEWGNASKALDTWQVERVAQENLRMYIYVRKKVSVLEKVHCVRIQFLGLSTFEYSTYQLTTHALNFRVCFNCFLPEVYLTWADDHISFLSRKYSFPAANHVVR